MYLLGRLVTFILITAIFIEAVYYAFQLQNMASDGAVLAGILLFTIAILAYAAYFVANVLNPFLKRFTDHLDLD